MVLLMEEILHQLIWRLSHYLQAFLHSRWRRISSINSIRLGRGSGAQLLIGGSQHLLNKERPPFSTVKVLASTFAFPRPFRGKSV